MTDARAFIDADVLKRNVGILVEALAADVYGLPKQAFLSGGFPDLDSELVSSSLDFIASNPRSQQMLDKDSQVSSTVLLLPLILLFHPLSFFSTEFRRC